MFKRNGKSKLKQILPTPASRDNGIKTYVVVIVAGGGLQVSSLIGSVVVLVEILMVDSLAMGYGNDLGMILVSLQP